jgi:NADH:ubiquinone oxidoreductase subunit E
LLDYIGQGMNLPRSEVYGVASFYALFSMTPKGRHTVKMCLGTACYVKGIKEVMNRVENQYKIKEGQTPRTPFFPAGRALSGGLRPWRRSWWSTRIPTET